MFLCFNKNPTKTFFLDDRFVNFTAISLLKGNIIDNINVLLKQREHFLFTESNSTESNSSTIKNT